MRLSQVVSVLKKELMRTQSKELERNGEYRQVLVQCVHKCAVKHPDVAAGVVHILMEFLGDSQTVGTMSRESSFGSAAEYLLSSCLQSYARIGSVSSATWREDGQG